jgi:2-phosphosulfolactate phosphatase
MSGTVVIDCLPESAARYRDRCAIVAIDVIRATTTATTALSLGRRVFPARTSDEASALAARLGGALLVGELGGHMPIGFDETNSPAAIANRADVDRPMVLVSSSGTELIVNSVGAQAVYASCLRNYSAVGRYLAGRHERVAVLGAGTRGRFRREDQIGCARVAEVLFAAGYAPENKETADYVTRWHGIDYDEIRGGESAAYLKRSGQLADLEFVLNHIDDVDTVPFLVDGELTVVPAHTHQPVQARALGATPLTAG